MRNAINWFEIPVTDIERAVKFYSTLFDIQLKRMSSDGFSSAMFPAEGGIGGALVSGNGYTPDPGGALIYLNANPDLNVVLERVERAGGQQERGKTDIGEDGFYAIIRDTEGNRIGLHSMS